MATILQKLKFDLHQKKYKMLLLYGLSKGLILPYDDELIERLRKVYYGGVPASIILLSNGLSNGHCYDRALLMSRAFLDTSDDVKLLYGDIDSLKLNPKFISDSPHYADHCFVERITEDGRELIYDTSCGFVFDKKLYWLMENPKIRHVNDKDKIKTFINEDLENNPGLVDDDKYLAPLILPFIEKTYGSPTEMYTLNGIELLQREIKHYKDEINYKSIVEETNKIFNRTGIRK